MRAAHRRRERYAVLTVGVVDDGGRDGRRRHRRRLARELRELREISLTSHREAVVEPFGLPMMILFLFVIAAGIADHSIS